MQHRSFWLQEALGDAPDQPPLEGAAARRRRDHGRRLRRPVDGDPHQGARPGVRRRGARAGRLRRRRQRPQRRRGAVVVGRRPASSSTSAAARRRSGIGKASVDAIGEIEEFCTGAPDRRRLQPRRLPVDGDHRGPAGRVGLDRRAAARAWARRRSSCSSPRRWRAAPARPCTSPACSTRAPRPSSRPSWPAACAAWRWRCGVRIHEHSRVTDLDRRSPAVLRTQHGVLTADRVVIATNAWAASMRELHTRAGRHLERHHRSPRRRPSGWPRSAGRAYEAISDSQVMIHYYRRTPTGRVMFGKGGWGIAMAGRLPDELRPPRGPRARRRGELPAHLPDARRREDRVRLVGADRPLRTTGCRSSGAWAGASTSSTASAGAATASARRCSAARSSPSLALGERRRVVAVAVRRRARRAVPARPGPVHGRARGAQRGRAHGARVRRGSRASAVGHLCCGIRSCGDHPQEDEGWLAGDRLPG